MPFSDDPRNVGPTTSRPTYGKVYLNSGSATISDKDPAGVHHFVEAITSSCSS